VTNYNVLGMKIFISSLIIGMEEQRQAAKDAIADLDHEPIMAEKFGAWSLALTACASLPPSF
jgi:hypothetical protein